jgi:hypothetical protein
MTAARQQRKSPLALGRALGLAFGLAVCGGIFASPAILAAPSDRIVVDAHSGLAISGFDPVAYFTDAKPKIGRPDIELRVDGAIWRFRNEGNRAAFADHPEVYSPGFGVYDPAAVARGAIRCRATACSGRSPASGIISSTVPRRARPSGPSRVASSSARCANGRRSRAPSRVEPGESSVINFWRPRLWPDRPRR